MLLFQEWVTPTALLAAANPEIEMATAYVCQPQQPDHHHQPKNFKISIETCFDSCSLLKLNNKSAVSVINDIFSTLPGKKFKTGMERNCPNLKGQCHKIFDHFFGLKYLTWAPYELTKTVLRNYLFLQRYSCKMRKKNIWHVLK